MNDSKRMAAETLADGLERIAKIVRAAGSGDDNALRWIENNTRRLSYDGKTFVVGSVQLAVLLGGDDEEEEERIDLAAEAARRE